MKSVCFMFIKPAEIRSLIYIYIYMSSVPLFAVRVRARERRRRRGGDPRVAAAEHRRQVRGAHGQDAGLGRHLRALQAIPQLAQGDIYIVFIYTYTHTLYIYIYIYIYMFIKMYISAIAFQLI